MFNWITLLHSRNEHNIVSQLSSSIKFSEKHEKDLGRQYSSLTEAALWAQAGGKARKRVGQNYRRYVLDAKSLPFLSLSLSEREGVVSRDDFIFYFVSGAELRGFYYVKGVT